MLCDVVVQATQNVFFSLLYFQFYKHVVQSVEKFIQKVSYALIRNHEPHPVGCRDIHMLLCCSYISTPAVFLRQCKPEYKVPGLYVIDSIVRQSRHQFGTEKDVFAPRFSKNIISTFQHLYRCPSDDKVRPFLIGFLFLYVASHFSGHYCDMQGVQMSAIFVNEYACLVSDLSQKYLKIMCLRECF